MKKRFYALCLLSAVVAYAEPESEPDVPSNLFFDTDVYIYEPKFRITYGARLLSGSKSAFSGFGMITDSLQHESDTTGTGENRIYHDGTVLVDPRGAPVDDGNGGVVNVPITPDGKTNSWSYIDASQVLPDGTIAMHSYTANILDSGPRTKDPSSSFGIELSVARDLGHAFFRFDWNMNAGLSLNDLRAKMNGVEKANITTITDTYSLNGAPAPAAPYVAPSTTSITVIDASGNPLLNADGSSVTIQVDNSTLLSNTPETRTTTTVVDVGSVLNHYDLKGAYFTFRAGPTLVFPITQGLRATLSLGAALVYAGTTYTVEQDFKPATGDDIISTENNTVAKLLPGYYVDAGMELQLTNRTGFYVSAIYQNNGSYSQAIANNGSPGLPNTANYVSKIDLSSLQGFRFGVNVRF